MKVTVIIPAYNEELTIASMVILAKRHVEDVVVVDDGSTDSTHSLAVNAGARVLRTPKNLGKTGAVAMGIEKILEDGFDAAVLMDADGQNNPDEIPIVLAPILADEADLVIGSRFLETRSDIPAYRQVGQKMLNSATRLSTKASITDTQSGYRAFNRKMMRSMLFKSEGYGLESEMIENAVDVGLRITEVPISVRYDVPNGHKRNPVVHGVGVMSDLVNAIGGRRPLLFFGSIGLMIFLFGVLIEVVQIARSGIHSVWIVSYWPFLFMALGIITMVSGLILNSMLLMKADMNRLMVEIGQSDEKLSNR